MVRIYLSACSLLLCGGRAHCLRGVEPGVWSENEARMTTVGTFDFGRAQHEEREAQAPIVLFVWTCLAYGSSGLFGLCLAYEPYFFNSTNNFVFLTINQSIVFLTIIYQSNKLKRT